jgi:hypothetical protein
MENIEALINGSKEGWPGSKRGEKYRVIHKYSQNF